MYLLKSSFLTLFVLLTYFQMMSLTFSSSVFICFDRDLNPHVLALLLGATEPCVHKSSKVDSQQIP